MGQSERAAWLETLLQGDGSHYRVEPEPALGTESDPVAARQGPPFRLPATANRPRHAVTRQSICRPEPEIQLFQRDSSVVEKFPALGR